MTPTVAVTFISPGGVRTVERLDALLDARARERARGDTNRWIKSLRAVPYGGTPMRTRFRHRNESLWWFTELYLQKERRLDMAVATILALERAAEQFAPIEIEIGSGERAVRNAIAAFARSRKWRMQGAPAGDEPRQRWASVGIGVATRLSRRRTAVRPNQRVAVAAFIHAAFWQATGAAPAGDETYVGHVLKALEVRLPHDGVTRVGLGPSRNFRARRWWDALLPRTAAAGAIVPIERFASPEAVRDSMAFWRGRNALADAIVEGDAIRAAATYHGVDLWPVLKPELQDAALVQWPWSVKAMNEAGAALDALQPDVAVTYAEAGGWGRALMLEARRRGVATAALQHGFIYRHWLNYLHEPDEMTSVEGDGGFPLPDRTLVFDRYAASHLERAGHFPSAALEVTGSAKLDDLVERMTALRPHAAGIRERLGLTDAPILVLAAKFSEIGGHLQSLFESVGELAPVELVIKAHPAEPPDVYRQAIGSARNIRVAPAGVELAELLTVAEGVVTMNSTVAIDCLALGIPAAVVGLPNNLTPFVEAGVMVGADGPGARMALASVVYDAHLRAALLERARAFAARHDIASDGRAAERAAAAVLALRAVEDGSAGNQR